MSLSLTFFEVGDVIKLSAVASGGSQALFYKFNAFGEEAFLNIIKKVMSKNEVYQIGLLDIVSSEPFFCACQTSLSSL